MSSHRFQSKRPGKRALRASSPWSIGLVFIGIVLLGLAAYAVWGNNVGGSPTAIEVKGMPRLKMDREAIDLGNVRLGQTVEARFRLTNVGDQPLRFAEAPYIEVVEGC